MSDWARLEITHENRFARVLGTPFLAFVCASSEELLTARLSAGTRLQLKQEEILAHVLSIAAQSAVTAFRLGGPESSFLYPLLDYDQGARLSGPNILRRQAGGDLPRVRYADDAERALAHLARDIYPALLVEDQSSFNDMRPAWMRRTTFLSPVLFRHPSTKAFEEAVERDGALNQIFSNETPESGKWGFIWTSLGTGQTIQLAMLAHTLLGAALSKLVLNDRLSHAEFVSETISQLRTLKRLVDGESINVNCALAFVGAEIRGTALKTPWGVIRTPANGELEFRSSTPVAHSQELVLAADVPFQIEIDRAYRPSEDTFPQSPFQSATAETVARLQRAADLVALTLLLGLERDPVVAIARTWTLIDNPLSHGPSLSWFHNVVPLHPHILSSADRPRIARWAQRVSDNYSDRIDIAVKRTLSSLTVRWDATDRLIDAVVALENLFGTGSGELRFRISTGCAYLLERAPGARLALQQECARLYDVRSKIVHGAHAPPPQGVEPDARAASLLAVRALRALFLKHPDLIDTKDRSTPLILRSR